MKELLKPFNSKDNMHKNILISGLTNKIKFNIERCTFNWTQNDHRTKNLFNFNQYIALFT